MRSRAVQLGPFCVLKASRNNESKRVTIQNAGTRQISRTNPPLLAEFIYGA